MVGAVIAEQHSRHQAVTIGSMDTISASVTLLPRRKRLAHG
jgi:hypothetical protein